MYIYIYACVFLYIYVSTYSFLSVYLEEDFVEEAVEVEAFLGRHLRREHIACLVRLIVGWGMGMMDVEVKGGASRCVHRPYHTHIYTHTAYIYSFIFLFIFQYI